MGKKSGKRPTLLLRGKARQPTAVELRPISPSKDITEAREAEALSLSGTAKSSKKKSRLWMRFDRSGRSELLECDRSAIVRRTAVPARDLRILGPLFSHSSSILAREKAVVINLEFVKAIVTVEEVLLLDPLCKDVLPFVDQLRQQLSLKMPFGINEPNLEIERDQDLCSPVCRNLLAGNEVTEGEQSELPFEFQVLEIALEVVCANLHSSAVDLEKDAYPLLDELTKNVCTMNLEHVRHLKGNLTRLLARVQKVRDEIEQLLDDDEDMAQLHLTRKQMQNRKVESLVDAGASNSMVAAVSNLDRHSVTIDHSINITNSIHSNDNDVEELEMLLEAYFVQLDGTRNKILSVREYIDDTEDYVNIQLDSQRNELIQLQLILTFASLAIALNTLIVGIFSINIPCPLYQVQHLFVPFVAGTSSGCLMVFLFLLGYAIWKKLLG